MDARVGRHGRAHIDADGRRVDELDVRDTLGVNLPDMCREALPFIFASSAGTRLSSTIVVLPEPDTPVTTVSRPLGMSSSKGLTVWMLPVERWIAPSANISPSLAHRRNFVSAFPERNGPIWDSGFASKSSIVPSAMTCPP